MKLISWGKRFLCGSPWYEFDNETIENQCIFCFFLRCLENCFFASVDFGTMSLRFIMTSFPTFIPTLNISPKTRCTNQHEPCLQLAQANHMHQTPVITSCANNEILKIFTSWWHQWSWHTPVFSGQHETIVKKMPPYPYHPCMAYLPTFGWFLW